MKTLVLKFIWATCAMLCVDGKDAGHHRKRRVVLLSFDGFRWDYVGRFLTPNLDSFADEGVHAPVGVRTAFVTKTFPDHYTLATGLYEESHGIVSNRMYDIDFNATFGPGNVETRWWDGGQPVWISATLQGLRAGVFFWPGSEVELDGVRPYRWQPYEKNVTFEHRVDVLVEWLVKEEVTFAAAYFHEPDGAGHKYGVFAPKVKEAVESMDNLLGYLIEKMKQEGIYESTDILVVSDHGMANVTADEEHVIVLEDFLNWNEDVLVMPDEGALANLLPRPGRENHVYQSLLGVHPNMTVYKKDMIPERYHYKEHRRVLPIVLVADEGYFITQKRPFRSGIGPGEHGYDNGLQSMRPIFFARGPHFKSGHNVSSSFETVNVYPLICHLLNIQPAPNNGSLEASIDFLIDEPGAATSLKQGQTFLFLTTVAILLNYRRSLYCY